MRRCGDEGCVQGGGWKKGGGAVGRRVTYERIGRGVDGLCRTVIGWTPRTDDCRPSGRYWCTGVYLCVFACLRC